VKLTDLCITSVRINVSKQPINPGSLKLMMAAASFISRYDAITLSNYTAEVSQTNNNNNNNNQAF
jgi:hypothetical protein